MKISTLLILTGALLLASAAAAQMPDVPDLSGPDRVSTQREDQSLTTVVGKIATVDLSRGIVTLNDGTELTLPPSFQPTSLPTVGEEVEVTFTEQGTTKMIRSIDLDTGGYRGQGG
jgi:hypothetical protein